MEKAYITRTSSSEKGSLTRSGSVDKSRKSVASSSPTSAMQPKRFTEFETPDNFFIDTILNRHARLLLTAIRLKDLGKFSAHLEFPLVPWLRKERNRAARVDNYVETLTSIHKSFDLPYPAVNQLSSAPLSPKPWIRNGRLSSVSSSSSTRGGRQNLDELEGRLELGIELGEEVEEEEAQLSPVCRNDESGRVSGDPSETSSVAHSMDGEEDWIWGGEGPSYVDVQEIRAQLAFSGSLQALREIRFLLKIFIEAKCHDWWFILSLVLRDSTCLTDFVDDMIKMRDATVDSLTRVKDGMGSLEAWAEQNCHGYQLFFGLHKEHWLALDAALEAAKNAPTEQKDSSPAPDLGRYSRQSSTSKDEEKLGNEEEESEEVADEEKSEYDCVVS